MLSLAEAISIAVEAHADQTDKSGQPFIGHPLRVMAYLAPDEKAMMVGILHDIVEDTPMTGADLLVHGFDHTIVDAVMLLSRRSTETYFQYIDRIIADDSESGDLARKVKRADLADNMDPRREFEASDGLIKKRYIPTLKLLDERDA